MLRVHIIVNVIPQIHRYDTLILFIVHNNGFLFNKLQHPTHTGYKSLLFQFMFEANMKLKILFYVYSMMMSADVLN